LVEKAKESTEKSKLLKKNCDEISFAKENYRRIKRDGHTRHMTKT
jgi:hypothetical protein